MKSRLGLAVVVCAGLALAGQVLAPLVAEPWRQRREREPALRLEPGVAAAGQGVTLALLGGFRALVADAAWIQMYARWERRDLAGTEAFARLVTTVDPRPVYFWLNAARILAYDFPAWRIEAAGGYDAVPAAAQRAVNEAQAAAALELLGAARRRHPDSVDLWVEEANIHLNRRGDPLAAAVAYREAWARPRAPYYVARLRAEVLRRAGRRAEALAWLREIHPALPAGDPGAGAELVLQRIRELEAELGVPAGEAYRPTR